MVSLAKCLNVRLRTKAKKKKNLKFPEIRVTREISWVGTNLFFNRFSGDILFSLLVSFAFFILVFLLFVCCFLNLKMYILIHNRLCWWVNDHPVDFRK